MQTQPATAPPGGSCQVLHLKIAAGRFNAPGLEKLDVTSCRYQGRRDETNMVIINIKLLSGYVLDQNSLQLVSSPFDLRLIKVRSCILTAGSAAAAEGRAIGEARGLRRRIPQHLPGRGGCPSGCVLGPLRFLPCGRTGSECLECL